MIALLGVIFLGGFFATVHPYAPTSPVAVALAEYNYDGCIDPDDDDPDVCKRDAPDDDDDTDKGDK